ncbi:hypothetical protein TSAR_000298, partial [Trichomalopsis sarcophagae]
LYPFPHISALRLRVPLHELSSHSHGVWDKTTLRYYDFIEISLRSGPGVTFSHKLSPRTDVLLIKRRRKLGPTKTKTLSRGLPKGLEAVRAILYIYSYTQAVMCSRERPQPLNSLAWQSQIGPFTLSALKVTLKIRGVKLLEGVVANKYAALSLIPSSPWLCPDHTANQFMFLGAPGKPNGTAFAIRGAKSIAPLT